MEELEADDGWPRARRGRRATCAWSASTSARRTRICHSAGGRPGVQWDRRRDEVRNEQGVIAKFGVPPASIPDYLALVGDSADGFPACRAGVPSRRRRCWGATATSRTSRDAPSLGRHRARRKTARRSAARAPRERLPLPESRYLARRGDPGSTMSTIRVAGPEPRFEDLAEGIGAPGCGGARRRSLVRLMADTGTDKPELGADHETPHGARLPSHSTPGRSRSPPTRLPPSNAGAAECSAAARA